MSFLVVFDVDSTLIDQEAIELLATHSGTRQEVALITERAMKGEIDFSASLVERVALLAGLTKTFSQKSQTSFRQLTVLWSLLRQSIRSVATLQRSRVDSFSY